MTRPRSSAVFYPVGIKLPSRMEPVLPTGPLVAVGGTYELFRAVPCLRR